jgi:hypothetical protein
LLALSAMFEGRGGDTAASAAQRLGCFEEQRPAAMRDGELIEDESEGIAFLEPHFATDPQGLGPDLA